MDDGARFAQVAGFQCLNEIGNGVGGGEVGRRVDEAASRDGEGDAVVIADHGVDFQPHARIEVSRSAILHNIESFERISSKRVIPVLKGNAYGHGIKLVARALKDYSLPYVAVDGYFEALRVREVSNQPVLVMGAILRHHKAHLTKINDHQAHIIC